MEIKLSKVNSSNLKLSENFNKLAATPQFADNFKFPSHLYYSPAQYISFGAMKKSDFSGFDFAFVNMVKAPINKFNDIGQLKCLAQEKLDKLLELEQYEAVEGVTKERDQFLPQGGINIVNHERMPLIKTWKNYLTQENSTYKEDPIQAYVIFSSIIKEINNKNTKCPPALNQRAVADTMEKISKKLDQDKNAQFNFSKEYQNTLQILAMNIDDDEDTGETMTGWIKIPSQENDSENFDKNVEKLKILSYPSWCTKSYNARPYLEKGDFHVYLENGKPKLGIRFEGKKITEIQGAKNNGKIPQDYIEVAKDYVHGELKDWGIGRKLVRNAENLREKLNKIKEELKTKGIDVKSDALENQKAIFDFFEIGATINNTPGNEGIILSKYCQPIRGGEFSFSDLGINEDTLLKNVIELDGDAGFDENSEATTLPSLKKIGGSAHFKNSKMTSLPLLESIGGDLDLGSSKITSLPSLKSIGGSLMLSFSKIADLPLLESIGEFAFCEGSEITSFPALKSIGQWADFHFSKVEFLPSIESIGGDVCVFGSPLEGSDIWNRVAVAGTIT